MVNDSAGTDVILVDKSQRPASADGFKAAVAIEAERGLCNKPVFITGTDDFVKVFGSPSFEKYGQANLEAYFLAQNNVPLVISRARNPGVSPTAPLFGGIRVTNDNGKLFLNSGASSSAIMTPPDKNTAMIYFKGEGQYCGKNLGEGSDSGNYSNIVLRFSEPATKSAYADKGGNHAVQLQVYDFAGQRHIDQNTVGRMGLTPNLDPVMDSESSGATDALSLKGYALVFDTGSSGEGGETRASSMVTAYVNGCKGEAPYYGGSVYTAIETAVLNARTNSGAPVITSFVSNNDGTFTVAAGKFNCFNLSISIAISAHATGVALDAAPRSAYLNYGCGSVAITPGADEGTVAVDFSLSTALYLENRKDYMYMGPAESPTSVWAACYAAFLKESYVVSFGYNDYDASYNSMQIDSVLASSNYLVSRTSEDFDDYDLDFPSEVDSGLEGTPAEATLFLASPVYFAPISEIESNLIDPGQRSYAYALALRQIAGDNVTKHRCVATPNLADVMTVPDFVGVIEAFSESTLGVSNIGKAASLDAFQNLGGVHGNRFIADFTQYGRRIIAGRRIWMTFAALVTLQLNTNYRNGNEARPPMGISYGRILCDELSQEFTGPERKVLAQIHKVNPAINDSGFYLWEETTSQLADTALSDEHVILSYCWMKYMIYQSMRPFVAEYNDVPTINEGVRVLKALNKTFMERDYIEEGRPNADKNIIGDKVMRFDFPVRFKGVGRYVDIYVTAYPQTQSLEISLAEDA